MKNTLLKILQRLLAKAARYYLFRTRPKIIGITGSVGKTSCRMIISQVLEKHLTKKVIYTSPKNYNSELGVVFSIFQIEDYVPGIVNLLNLTFKILWKSAISEKKYDVIIIEYGVDHPGDMDFLLSIAIPDYAIFTKLDKIHSCYFDSPNGIGDEKIKLLHAAKKKVYLNGEDDFLRSQYKGITQDKKYFQDIKNYKLKNTSDGVFAEFKAEEKKYEINIPGIENALYVTLGVSLLEDLGEKLYDYDLSLHLELQPGRFTFFQGKKDSVLIDSTYNAGPESMKKMIENTFDLQKQVFPDYKVMLVLGEMRELGEAGESEHKKLTKIVSQADEIYLIGEQMEYLKHELEKNNKHVTYGLKSRKIGKQITGYLENRDEKYLILFKGSQNTIFTEEALKQVLIFPKDKSKLVRRSAHWMKQKEEFFKK